MKVTLLLVLCLAGMSVQQNLFWPFPSQARFQYLPQLLNRKSDQPLEGVESKEAKEVSQYRYNNEMDFPLDRYNPFYYAFNPFNSGKYPDQEARVKSSSAIDSESRLSSAQDPAARFFLPWPFGLGLGLGLGKTETFYSFVSTVITTTTIRYCTEASAFSNINSCRRRRETLFKLLEDRDRVEPTPVDQVEVTAVPKVEAVPVAREEPSVPAITSSLESIDQPNHRMGRNFLRTLTVTTLASTSSTVTVTSTVRSSAILPVGSKLICVPAGASIC